MPEIGKEEKIRGYRRNLGGGGGVDKNLIGDRGSNC